MYVVTLYSGFRTLTGLVRFATACILLPRLWWLNVDYFYEFLCVNDTADPDRQYFVKPAFLAQDCDISDVCRFQTVKFHVCFNVRTSTVFYQTFAGAVL